MIGAMRAQPLLNVRLDFLSLGPIDQCGVEIYLQEMPPVALWAFDAEMRAMLNVLYSHYFTLPSLLAGRPGWRSPYRELHLPLQSQGQFERRIDLGYLLFASTLQFFFFSSSTTSASITSPSPFEAVSAVEGPAPASVVPCGGAPAGAACLYMASASLCEAVVSRSTAALILETSLS